jgi:hypothetical protein
MTYYTIAQLKKKKNCLLTEQITTGLCRRVAEGNTHVRGYKQDFIYLLLGFNGVFFNCIIYVAAIRRFIMNNDLELKWN